MNGRAAGGSRRRASRRWKGVEERESSWVGLVVLEGKEGSRRLVLCGKSVSGVCLPGVWVEGGSSRKAMQGGPQLPQKFSASEVASPGKFDGAQGGKHLQALKWIWRGSGGLAGMSASGGDWCDSGANGISDQLSVTSQRKSSSFFDPVFSSSRGWPERQVWKM